MSLNLNTVKETLLQKGYESGKVSRAISYLASELNKKDNNVSRHNELELINLFIKYYNAGTNLDGINVVLAGKNMGLISYHGYMNKIKEIHPNVFFDIQIVRKDDKFSFAKESGSIIYSHEFTNPFEDAEIIGAYCIVTLEDKNQSIELLNKADYEKMKDASRNKSVWLKWSTEFWRKSVIKRACKIYFAEEIKDIDKIDNDDYGIKLENEKATKEQKDAILKAHGKIKT